MALAALTVTGAWMTDDGKPAVGHIEFRPNASRFINSGIIVAAKPYDFPLDTDGKLNGKVGVAIARNGSTGTAGGYTVTEYIEGAASFTYILPDEPTGSVDLSDYPKP